MNDIKNKLIWNLHQFFEKGAKRANNEIGTNQMEKNSSYVKADGGYKCIHLNPDRFCSIMEGVLKNENIAPTHTHTLKFLDIGCGVGEKIYLASLFNLNTFGLELRPQLIEEGKRLLESIGFECGRWETHFGHTHHQNCFIQGDALTYDYKEFDILYFYCPLMDSQLQEELEEQIVKTAKSGAIIIPFLAKGICAVGNIPGWTCKNGQYFVKN